MGFLVSFCAVATTRAVWTVRKHVYNQQPHLYAIRNAVVSKVSPQYYTIRYEYAPDGGYWIQDIKILKDKPYYEKDTQFCCLSLTYEEASSKLWEVFKKEGDSNVW